MPAVRPAQHPRTPRFGQSERVALIVPRNAEVFGDAAGLDFGRSPGGALHELAASSTRAFKARRVMVHENAVADAKDPIAGARPRWPQRPVVPKHQRRFAPTYHAEDIAAADAAGLRLNEYFTVAQFRHRPLLDAHSSDVVEHRGAHRLRVSMVRSASSAAPPVEPRERVASRSSGTSRNQAGHRECVRGASGRRHAVRRQARNEKGQEANFIVVQARSDEVDALPRREAPKNETGPPRRTNSGPLSHTFRLPVHSTTASAPRPSVRSSIAVSIGSAAMSSVSMPNSRARARRSRRRPAAPRARAASTSA